ncbi:MAG: hypothetical protein MJE63_32730 [Proteobacteria bacterium]|nr:hypothetical protein [Pseudomonadota bacterium]
MRKRSNNFGCTPPPVRLLTFIFDLLKQVIGNKGNSSQNNSKLNVQEKQSLVLKAAKKNNGRLTIAEVTMETALSLDESKSILEGMCTEGVAELQITDGGSLVYVFTGLLTDKEKDTAKEPLNR